MSEIDFQNPDPFPRHEGGYSISLFSGVDTSRILQGTATIENRKTFTAISVLSGSVEQIIQDEDEGTFQFEDDLGNRFLWKGSVIFAIYDQNGNHLWCNPTHGRACEDSLWTEHSAPK